MWVLCLIDSRGTGGAERRPSTPLRFIDRDAVVRRVCVPQERDVNPVADTILAMNAPVAVMPTRRHFDRTAPIERRVPAARTPHWRREL